MRIFINFCRSSFVRIVSLNLILIWTLTIISPVFSQDISETLLREGIKSYEDGELDQAIVKLSSCIEMGGANKTRLGLAYKYLAQAYIAKEYREQATKAIENLLKIMPNYKPDVIEDRPQYVELVEAVKQKMKAQEEPAETIAPTQKKSNLKKWLVIGGGTAAGGILLAVLLWPKDGKEPLPVPPALP